MAIVIQRMPREYVSVPGHAKTAHDFMLVNEEVHAESCLMAGAWRCFQQNGNFNASTDQQNGNFTLYRYWFFLFLSDISQKKRLNMNCCTLIKTTLLQIGA
ncbi:unnamed protein product [Cuscuta campestris]|uniref:Uncharacterized protein n=1 Tax=Cuscuta campestris TaxID=132261 RepID=A0A484M4T2_9ASTE|nr:unnamed protein product [Cuscuta campestris]